MGLLDSVISSLTGGGASGSSSPIGGILSSPLGGSGQQAGGAGQAAGGAGMSGGIGGLVSTFEQRGLGDIAKSRIGNGPNKPVSPQQSQGVFGEDQVNGMAQQAGMQPNDFLSQLSRHLPKAVDGATPNGRLPPNDGSVSV